MPGRNDTAPMTLDEQIGQLIVVGFQGMTPSPEVIDLIENHHVGGIILFSRNIQDTRQLLELTSSLQAIAQKAGHRSPLLISLDQENGAVSRLGHGATLFPGSMALGATGSAQMARDIAYASGRELHALGINMNLAPVVDVNNNPDNPVIGPRSFGEDPHHVGLFTTSVVQGYREAGLMTCLKHFPGHGDTAVDSHRFLPSIPHTIERLEAVELLPFKSGIAAGAASVMVAHIAFPSIMPVAVPGNDTRALAATASPAIVQELLRERLGFDGVIISDCLEMSAILKTIGTQLGTVLALRAGIDLLLISHSYQQQVASIGAIKEAIAGGKLARERILQASRRVLRMKNHYLSWLTPAEPIVPTWVGGIQHACLRDQVYDMAVTILRDEKALLPLQLQTTERLLVLYPEGEAALLAEDRSHSAALLGECLKQQHANVCAKSISLRPAEGEREQIQQEAAHCDIIIMLTMNAHLYRQQAELMQGLIHLQRRLIGIAVYNPYDLLAFPQLGTYLATYECTLPALEAIARVLFGVTQAKGRLPVSLPGMYPLGYCMPMKSSGLVKHSGV